MQSQILRTSWINYPIFQIISCIGRSNEILDYEGIGNRQLFSANLKLINKKIFLFFLLSLRCFTLKIDSYSRSKYLRTPFAKNVSNGEKFKLYIVPNGLLFSTPPQSRFSFERMIYVCIPVLVLVVSVNDFVSQ
jgi:hypothetical protein